MQIKFLFRLVLLLLPVTVFGQSTYIRIGSPDYELIDRLEIKSGNPLLTQSLTKPFLRKRIFPAIDSILKHNTGNLTATDIYKAKQLLNDPEWYSSTETKFSTAGFQSANSNGYVTFNPIVRMDIEKEKNSGKHPNIFSLGFDTRGIIFKKIGFDFYVTTNKERLPVYLNNWLSRYNHVPGVGNFERKDGRKVSYWDVRGSIQTSVTKYIDLQLGYDRQFLGNGYRSLFLSDFSGNAAFVKINAKIWKLNLQSLYMKLTPQDGIVQMADTKKYLRINTVGVDVNKWLNISFFDAVILGRKNGFDLNYILPVTFLRAMEQQSGSPDNALIGFNAKVNIASKVQLYGQMLLDEFKLSEMTAKRGWWANKYGYQFGIKYIDAFSIKNLDLQIETNRVRPFTYTHFDSVSNYSHYNQPLAHPLGANFQEFFGLINYYPLKKLRINAKIIYYKQGLDSLGYNTGNNVLINYNVRPREYGWEVGSGDKATCLYFSTLVSYEIIPRMFIDFALIKRNFKTQLLGNINTTLVSAGIRWNISKREFDF